MTPIKKILTGTTMLSPNAFVLRDPVTIGTAILGLLSALLLLELLALANCCLCCWIRLPLAW
jgi:hypothetical protein